MSGIDTERELASPAVVNESEGDEQTIEAPAADTSVRALQTLLKRFGWPLAVTGATDQYTFDAVRQFQRGFAWWSLLVDGYAGPKTWEALEYAQVHGGRCSAHFTFSEFKCHCGRAMADGCAGIKVSRDLVLGLETFRTHVGHPVALRSGYRDPYWNKKVGGKPNSQHLYGNATDLRDPEVRYSDVRALKAFSGIGYYASSGLVVHVDVRHVGPNPTRGTLENPSWWMY